MPQSDGVLTGGPSDETVMSVDDAALLEVEIDGLVHRYIRTTRTRQLEGRELPVFNYDGVVDPGGALSGAETR